MPDAVGPGRAGQPGSGGGQPAPGGPPPPKEAKAVESKPFGASASDADPVAGLSDRAQERFRELTQRLKGAEEELARYRSQPSQPAKSPEPGLEQKTIDELRRMARKAMDTDPEQAISFIEQMSEIKATAAAQNTLKGFLTEMQEREAQSRFRTEAESSWQRALSAFPELSDDTTEFYGDAKRLWETDPYLKQIPDGMLKAAQIAWSERSRRGGKPASLETSSVPQQRVIAENSDVLADRNAALEGLKAGNQDAAEAFFMKHADKVIRKR